MNVSRKQSLFWFAFCLFRLSARSQTAQPDPRPHWQQQVDYHIDVRLDDADHTLDGSITIRYTNRSPDTLSYIWIDCWPNAFKNDRTAFSEQRLEDGKTDFYFSDPPQRGYINRLDFRVDGAEAKMEDHPQYIDIIKLILPQPLLPGSEINLTTPFHTQLPYNFSGNGWSTDRYQVLQWYPKPAAYDSTGWHTLPYLGQAQRPAASATFDVSLTLPKTFAVAVSGQQDSAPAIAWTRPTPPHKTTGFFNHGQQALKKRPSPTQAPPPDTTTRTLHYTGQNTTDFTWFADRNFPKLHDTLNWPQNPDPAPTPRRWLKPALPALGYNEYDHLMIGVLIHNFDRPSAKLKFFLAPLYATQSHRLNGIAQIFYTLEPGRSAKTTEPGRSAQTTQPDNSIQTIQPDHSAKTTQPDNSIQTTQPGRRLQKVQFGLGLARFSTVSGTDSSGHQLTGGYYKVTPSILIVFANGNAHRTFQTSLEGKTYLIREKTLDNYVLKTSDSSYYPTQGKYNFRYVNQLSLQVKDSRVLYPYKTTLQFQQAANFFRVNLNGNYFFNYAKGGGLDLRVFGAKFGYLGGQPATEDLSRFEPKLTAVRGNEDYTYDNFFLGRNAFTGFPSQQIMDRDGDLHLRTDLFQGLQGRSDDWVTSLNARTTLPRAIIPEWLPLKIFFDVGTYAGAWQANPPTSHFLYTGGFELDLFHDVLRIYAPLVYSSDFSSQLRTVPDENSFWKKISFSLDLRNIDWKRLLGNSPI